MGTNGEVERAPSPFPHGLATAAQLRGTEGVKGGSSMGERKARTTARAQMARSTMDVRGADSRQGERGGAMAGVIGGGRWRCVRGEPPDRVGVAECWAQLSRGGGEVGAG